MSWKDDDVHFRVVSGPPTYAHHSDDPVIAAPVRRGDDLRGYLVTSADPAGGVLVLLAGYDDEDYVNIHSDHWWRILADGAANGIPAHELFDSLVGTAGPERSGAVGTDIVTFPNTAAVSDALNPPRPDRNSRGGAARGRAASPEVARTPVTREQIDAVLRGVAPSTPEIDARIAALDGAVRVRPAPETVVVALPYDADALPAGAAPGTRVHEPTFLVGTFLTRETVPTGPTMLHLTIPAGTPALYTPPAPAEAGAGTLLLARGLDWEITELGAATVSGRVVSVPPSGDAG